MNAENRSIHKYFEAGLDLKITITHSISENSMKTIILSGDKRAGYFADFIEYHGDFINRGESISSSVYGKTVRFETPLLHNSLFIEELEFTTDGEHPQLVRMSLIDGD